MKKINFFVLLLFALSQIGHSQNVQGIVQEFMISNVGESNMKTSDVAEWEVTDIVPSLNPAIQHVYVQQKFQGIPVENGRYKLTLKEGKISWFINQFISDMEEKTRGVQSSLSPEAAIMKVVDNHGLGSPLALNGIAKNANSLTYANSGISIEPITADRVYFAIDDKIVMGWKISLYQLDGQHWWNEIIDASTGEILATDDWVISCNFDDPNHKDHDHSTNEVYVPILEENSFNAEESAVGGGSYNVYPLGIESPNHGNRVTVNDPAVVNGSPFGWHDTNGSAGAEFTITRGNNVWAQEDLNGNNGTGASPNGGSGLNFNFPLNLNNAPSTFLDAATTNLFYWNNIMHDVWYNYGFDEPSGNFQEVNATGMGVGGDYVDAEAQDGGSTCNARMSTFADGVNARMQMFTCGTRDGDFDNLVIAHEFGHGISKRLVGGPNTTGCLDNQEQMGEGWSDFFGLVMTMEPGDTPEKPRTVGTYLDQQPANGPGFRHYPYSTNMTVNPITYDTLYASRFSSAHGVGTIWCTMLWDLNWALIDQYGWDADLYNGTGGNNMAMHLVTLGLKLLPCGPGFVDGRDAILAADRVLYSGANECLIWNAFAKRGLGFSASQGSSANRLDGSEAYDFPPSCAVLLQKTVDKQTASPGEEITYTIYATNKLPFDENNIDLKDFLPQDLEYVSSSPTATVSGQVVTWPTFGLTAGGNTSFTLTAKVKESTTPADLNFLDDLESGTANWIVTTSETATWNYQSAQSNSSSHAYFCPGAGVSSNPILTLIRPSGISDSSELIFHHSFDIEISNAGAFAYDGGVVEISTDFGETWEDLGDKITQNGYNFPHLAAGAQDSVFSGQSGGWIETKVDLSSYADEQVLIRFQMKYDVSEFEEGWYIDDVRITNQTLLTVNQVQAIYTGQISSAYVDENTEIVFIDLEDCTENESTEINNSDIPSNDYRAANNITSAGTVKDGSEVKFYAGISISLELGFHAEAGADFLAKIEECEEGGVSSFNSETVKTTARINTPVSDLNLLENTLSVRPNPFHQEAIIDYQVAQSGQLWIGLHDITGKVIKVLQPKTIREAGNYQLILNNRQLESGVYWLSMRTESGILTKKVFLIK